jgi:predicted Zn-dependent protease
VLPPAVVRAAALHEVGHLLGLNHSPDSTDIMFEKATAATRDITRADRRTLHLLYRLPPGPTR